MESCPFDVTALIPGNLSSRIKFHFILFLVHAYSRYFYQLKLTSSHWQLGRWHISIYVNPNPPIPCTGVRCYYLLGRKRCPLFCAINPNTIIVCITRILSHLQYSTKWPIKFIWGEWSSFYTINTRTIIVCLTRILHLLDNQQPFLFVWQMSMTIRKKLCRLVLKINFSRSNSYKHGAFGASWNSLQCMDTKTSLIPLIPLCSDCCDSTMMKTSTHIFYLTRYRIECSKGIVSWPNSRNMAP